MSGSAYNAATTGPTGYGARSFIKNRSGVGGSLDNIGFRFVNLY